MLCKKKQSKKADSDDDSDDDLDEEDDEEEDEEDFEDNLDEDEEDDEEDSDVFGLTKKTKKNKEIKVDFDVPKEMVELISGKFGVKDPEKFFNSVATWRSQAQEGVEVRKELTALEADLSAMPPDMKTSISLWAKGQDYTKPFVMNQRLDFSKGFEKQDQERLVQHYHSDQYEKLTQKLEKEELTAEEFNDKIELLASSTEKTFNSDKSALEKEREEFAEKQKNEYRLMKKSASLSVEKLSKAYPNFRVNELNKVRTILIDGKIDDLFYNEDGSYNEDAAERIAYALFGSKIKNTIESVSKRRGESEANQKIVDSSPKQIKKTKSNSQGKDKADLSVVKHLTPMFKHDPYA